ncbi:MAG: protein translocase subunit SecF [Minwuia sp.]|uniref:protein translocase subunit SecF n=1 Tax=Minwuia sp. TaxID=2493630 RepID=UPI003A89C77A
MIRLTLVPQKTNIPFMKFRLMAFVLSGFLAISSLGLFGGIGLNKGIDFEGGILIEVGTEGPADLSQMRDALGGLGLGEVALQEFGAVNDVLIRVERQEGEAPAQQAAVDAVKKALEADNPGISYRRVEFVGPKVSGELVESALLAVATAVVAMLLYIWLRFEWQFSVGAVLALVHDVVLTIGFFAITRIEFNLASVAAILTIVGYSINDTVVVYDRIRENLRKYKQMPLGDLLSLSINDTLSRTVMTSVTTLLALAALFFFGGEVIRGFSAAMIWGVVIGTYSSIFIAAPLLLILGLQRSSRDDEEEAEKEEIRETL